MIWRFSMFWNMFEINYSQLIQYEILEKLVTFIVKYKTLKETNNLTYHWFVPCWKSIWVPQWAWFIVSIPVAILKTKRNRNDCEKNIFKVFVIMYLCPHNNDCWSRNILYTTLTGHFKHNTPKQHSHTYLC